MKISTISNKTGAALAALLWLIVWQLAAMTVGQAVLLASPVDTLAALVRLVGQGGFWASVGFSLARIACGFLLAIALGSLLAACAAHSRILKTLLSPLLAVIKATPVASFIIVALIWVPSRGLSVLISFLMAFPVIYLNVAEGVEQLSPELCEMSQLFRVPFFRRLRYFYLPALLDHFYAACAAALGLSWKAGIAAEVIGIPAGSLGEKLYEAKVYLNTPELFAWTLVIIALSVLTEKLVLRLLRMLSEKGGRM